MNPLGRALQVASTAPQLGETVLHGGDLASARRWFPGAPEPWIDLSTGINPFAYPLPPIEASAWTQLPQSADLQKLIAVAVRRYGARTDEMLAAAAGTQPLLEAIPRILPISQVAILGPTYDEHRAAWQRAGHEVREVDGLDRVGDARAVVVVNPNNPTGRITPVRELARIAAVLERRHGLLIVDEAFADVMGDELSLVPHLPAAAIVLRSFGKAYGLAGVRLAFAVAQPEMARRLREMLGPWPVSGPAIAVGTAALADDSWLAEAVKTLERSGRRLDALLASSGCTAVGGTPLFRLVRHDTAGHIAETLGPRGILVRQFAYEPSWLRFGMPGSEDSWLRLTDALTEATGRAA
jgi:cobalamin biosynthetic protein CobC